jgi:hypothetical protein
MPKKIKVDAAKLISAVNSGMTDKEILEKFGLKTRTQLKSLYLDALVAEGAVKSISSRTKSTNSDAAQEEIRVNKRGSLVVPRSLVEEMGFAEGDAFSARRTRSGVSLRKI